MNKIFILYLPKNSQVPWKNSISREASGPLQTVLPFLTLLAFRFHRIPNSLKIRLDLLFIIYSMYEVIHISTAVVHQSEEWSSQWIFQFKQLERRSLKKNRTSTGFKLVTSAISVRCSTNWVMKPHIGSEVKLLSSYLPVQWNDEKFIWNNSC